MKIKNAYMPVAIAVALTASPTMAHHANSPLNEAQLSFRGVRSSLIENRASSFCVNLMDNAIRLLDAASNPAATPKQQTDLVYAAIGFSDLLVAEFDRNSCQMRPLSGATPTL